MEDLFFFSFACGLEVLLDGGTDGVVSSTKFLVYKDAMRISGKLYSEHTFIKTECGSVSRKKYANWYVSQWICE